VSEKITPEQIFAFLPVVANLADQVTDVFDHDPLHSDKRQQLIEAVRAMHALAAKVSPDAKSIPPRAFALIVGGVWDVTQGALLISEALKRD
jgi:hypothetical protein